VNVVAIADADVHVNLRFGKVYQKTIISYL